MARSIKLLVYPVKDVEKAKVFYGKFLDTEPYVVSSYYVGYRVGDQEVGLDPNSNVGLLLIQMLRISRVAFKQ